MRSVILATSVALALGSIPAAAQITSRVTAANNATPSTTTTTQATTSSSATENVTTAPAASSTTPAADTGSTTAGGASNAFGNSSTGLGAGSATLDPAAVGTVGSGPAVTNPDGTVLGTTGVNVVGERVPAPSNGVAAAPTPSFSIINTPTFDQAAREGRAKEQARKARGEEPRVYGIAPRTENDLTHQMPDDKIIRY